MANAKYQIPIVFKSDNKGIKTAETGLSGLEKTAIGVGIAVAAGLAVASKAIFDLGVQSVKAASDFQETSSAVSQIFGTAGDQLKDFAKTAANTLGQTRTQFLDGTKTFGAFGKAAGLADEENVVFAKNLAVLATDLASFNNTSVDDALQALGAALRGETEPMRRYQVLLDDATLKARAMEMGIYDGNGALTLQQKVLAANAEIFAQTSIQQGDYARTAEGAANATKTLQAQFEDMKITIGEALLPAIEAVLPELQKFIENLVASPEFNGFIADLGENFSNLLQFLPGALDNLGQMGKDAMPAISAFFPALNEALGLMGAVFFGIEDSDPASTTRDFASSMQTLRDALNGVAGALRWLTEMWNGLPSWLKMSMPEVIGFLATNPFTGTKTKWWTDLFGPERQVFTPPSAPTYRTGGLKLAEGGIVPARPGGTMATIGEGGQAEAVIPLDRFDDVVGKRGGSINIVVNAGMGTDGAAVGEQIVNAIRRYERTSGAVFARA
jgi:hypothetical protein